MKKRQAIALPPRMKKAVARLRWPVLGFFLCAGQMAGVYAPFALAAVTAAGIRLPGLAAVMGVAGGAFLFMDFQSGLRCTAAAILIFAANTALYDTAVYKKPYFRPACAAIFLLLVQSIYLLGRSGQSWLLALCAAATAAGAAWLTVIRQGKWGVLCGLVLAAVPVTAFSFSVGRALMMALLLALCLPLSGGFRMPLSALPYMAGLVIGSTLLGHAVFAYALSGVSANVISFALLGEPVGAMIFSMIFFGEVPTWPVALGGLLTLMGLALYLAFAGGEKQPA